MTVQLAGLLFDYKVETVVLKCEVESHVRKIYAPIGYSILGVTAIATMNLDEGVSEDALPVAALVDSGGQSVRLLVPGDQSGQRAVAVRLAVARFI